MAEIIIASIIAGVLAYALVTLTWERARRRFTSENASHIDPPAPVANQDTNLPESGTDGDD